MRIAAPILMSLFAAFVLVLAGCQGPVVPNQDTLNPYPQVHLTSYNLQGEIAVKEPIVTRVGAGQLDVVVPVRNLTGNELYLQFQYRFLNQQGAQVEQTSGWMDLRIPAYSMSQAHFTSLTALAQNFDVVIDQLE
ncbi:MAG TPA: DUF1425 domain-containing protein [Phycisphaerae bacterium]|nr:DUF1425 domain-containing protein [Phycisphaerae bacterium]